MSIERKQSSERMSKIVIQNNATIYLSGQVADDVTMGIQEQTTSCLKKIDALLAEAGSDRNHLVVETIRPKYYDNAIYGTNCKISVKIR